jgi:hypothetical protein
MPRSWRWSVSDYPKCGQIRVDPGPEGMGMETTCPNEALYWCGGREDWPVCEECLIALLQGGIDEAGRPTQIERPEDDECIRRMRVLTKAAYGDELSVSYHRGLRPRNGEPGPHIYVGFSSHSRIEMNGHPRVLKACEAALLVLAGDGSAAHLFDSGRRFERAMQQSLADAPEPQSRAGMLRSLQAWWSEHALALSMTSKSIHKAIGVALCALEQGKPFPTMQVLTSADDEREAEVHDRAKVAEALFAKALDAAELLWGVVANASGGEWKEQSEEWRSAAVRARDGYHAVLDARRVANTPFEELLARSSFGTDEVKEACKQTAPETVEKILGRVKELEALEKPVTRPSDDDLIEASLELEERAQVLHGKAEDSRDDEFSDAPRYLGTADRLDRVAAWLDAVRLGKEQP